jgi:hypothetical protein
LVGRVYCFSHPAFWQRLASRPNHFLASAMGRLCDKMICQLDKHAAQEPAELLRPVLKQRMLGL